MIDRTLSLFVAVTLALLVWLYARSRDQEVLDHVPIPVSVVLAENQAGQYSLEVEGPAQVLATFTGPPARIRELRGMIQSGELRVELLFSVPSDRLKENRLNETLPVEPSALHTPPGVTTTLVAGRNQVRVVLHRLGEKRLPVRFEHSLGAQAVGVVVEPESVLVRGPRELLEKAAAIPTQPWVLSGLGESGRGGVVARVPLATELEGRPVTCEPASVIVRAGGQPPRKVYHLIDVPVHFLCPASFPLKPRFPDDRAGKVSLRVTGPPRAELPRVAAFIDLTRGTFAPGRHAEPLQLQLPKDFDLAEGGMAPPNVAFELVPGELPPGGLVVSPASND